MMRLSDLAKSYAKGFVILVVLLVAGLSVLVLYAIYGSLYLLIIGILTVVTAFIIPFYLGKSSKLKPGDYSLKKVK